MRNHELDARRLLCPMPVIKTQNIVKELKNDDILSVYCTDPGVIYDIPAWCSINGHQVLDIQEIEKEIVIKIKVGKKIK